MLRCRQTCELLFPDANANFENNLREIDFGRWEGLTFEEISTQDPEIVTEWANDLPAFSFPEGEAVDLFNKRVQTVATEISAERCEKILVVSHGGVIRSLLCHFLGINLCDYLKFQVKKGTYSTVDLFGTHGVLTGFNLQ